MFTIRVVLSRSGNSSNCTSTVSFASLPGQLFYVPCVREAVTDGVLLANLLIAELISTRQLIQVHISANAYAVTAGASLYIEQENLIAGKPE